MLVALVAIAIIIFSLCPHSGRELFVNTPVVADIIYVYHDGPDSKNFTPHWAKFTDDYRDTLHDNGVAAHKYNDKDSQVQQYTLKEYPAILLTNPDHGAVKAVFSGTRSVQALADFVHTSFPAFDRKKFRNS